MRSLKDLNSLNNLFWIFILLFLSVLFWALTFELDRSINMQGEIKPKGRAITLQNRFEGKILKIHVEEGDFVSSDQELITFETDVDVAELKELESSIISLNIGIDRLLKQIKRDYNFSPDYSRLSQENNYSLININNQLAEQQEELKSELKSLDNEIDILFKEKRAKQTELMMLEASAENLEVQINVALSKFELTKELFEMGYEGKIAYMEAEGEVLNKKQELDKTNMQIELVTEEIKSIEDEKGSLIANFERETIKQLNIKREELRKAIIRKNGIAAKMNEFVLVSPANGVISLIEPKNAGQVFSTGDKLIELIPEEIPLVFYGELPIRYINDVQIDLQAKIVPSTLDTRTQQPLEGRVTSIAPDVTNKDDGSSFYSVTIEFQKDQKNMDVLRSGVTASGSIILGKRTVFEYYFEPINKLFLGALTED